MTLQFRILGDLELRRDDVPLELGGLRQRSVLAVLLSHSNAVVSSESIAEALWPDDQPASAIKTVQVYVSRLRQLLGVDRARLTSLPSGYRLTVAPEELDATRFESLAAEGIGLAQTGNHKAAASTLTDALRLWRGDALTDFRYESFARAWIAQLEERRLEVQERRFWSLLETGEDVSLVGPLRHLIDEHPLSERLWVVLVRALYRAGRQAEALDALRKVRALLLEQLGLDPGPELQQLELAVLNQDEVLARDIHPHNLPVQLSSFVGRDAELASLAELLDRRRLVTLTGPGGIGKTRLALQVASERLERHPDGVFFVDLAPLRDPSLVSATIASTLGLHEVPGDPITRTLQEYLTSRRVLLVLDNLEHLLPAAAAVVAGLLSTAPQLHIVATSRAPVRVRGEREYGVPPLASGSPGELGGTLPPAVALFIDRARDVQPGLTIDGTTGLLIAEICARLDGLPLAIELAAARLRLLALPALRDRLSRRLPLLTAGSRDLPERQTTLRATIAWSEELLTPTQQRLFARLSVFTGGFTLEAVERVGRLGLEGVDLVDLAALVEHSLVRSLDDPLDAPRYTMLETIREYALERLEAGTESAAIRDRLAEYLVDMVAQAEPRLTTEEQTVTLQRLDRQLDDLRAALAWLRLRGDGQRLGRLAAGFARYCTHRGLLSEGRRWIAEARGLAPDADALLTAKLLHADGVLASELGELDEAASLLYQSGNLYRARGDTGNLARVLVGLASTEQSRGELNAATEAGVEARQLARAQGDMRSEASAVGNLALIALRAGRLDEAEAGIAEAAELFRKTGDRHGVAIGLGNLAEVARKRGDVEAWGRGARDALAAARELGDTDLEGWTLANLAAWHLEEGDLDQAAADLAAGLSKLASAEDALAAAAGVDTAGLILARRSQLPNAVMAWGASDATAARMGALRERDSVAEGAVAAARDALGEAEFKRLSEVGAAMSLSEVIELVVSRLSDRTTGEGDKSPRQRRSERKTRRVPLDRELPGV